MALEYFCCFFSYREKLSSLTDEQAGKVFRAAMLYAETGELTDLEPLEALAFDFIRFDVDRSKQEYEKRCEKNRENINRRYQSNTVEYDRNQTKTKSKSKTESNNRKGADKPPRTQFKPPTVEEVTEYCQERRNNIDPQRFVDFYDSNGWVQGKGKPIRDWKATVRTWENRGTNDTNANKNQESDGWAYIAAVGKGEVL